MPLCPVNVAEPTGGKALPRSRLVVVLAAAAVWALVLPGCGKKQPRRARRKGRKSTAAKKKSRATPSSRLKRGAAQAEATKEAAALFRLKRGGPTTASNEEAAIAALKSYVAAQNQFRKEDRYGKGDKVYANPKDGKGFVDLLKLPGGEQLGLIDAATARATSAAGAKDGYYFVDVTADQGGLDYDYVIDHGLCAAPAEYGETGVRTFVVDVTGTIWARDNAGKPVTTHADLEGEEWEPAGF